MGANLILPAGSAADAPPAADPVTRSLRLASGSSTGDSSSHLDRNSIGTPTDGTKWTFSAWVKRSELTNKDCIFGGGTSSANWSMLRFRDVSGTEGQLFYDDYTTGSNHNWRWLPRFRDPSAFFNLMLVYDASQSVQADKMRLYVNGVLAPSASTHGASSTTHVMSPSKSGMNQIIGNNSVNDAKANLLIADVYFLDGVAKTVTGGATDFSELNSFGGLKPKAYTGTDFGNNGFHLLFENTSAIGEDSTSNSNDFSVTNLSSHDVLLDTPTSNFCTFSPISGPPRATTTISEGNLKVVGGFSTYYPRVMGTVAVSSGKWFYEVRCGSTHTSSREYGFKGVNTHWPTGGYGLSGGSSSWATESEMAFSAYHGGVKFSNSSSPTTNGTSWGSDGDVIGLALDLDSSPRTLRVFKDGSEVGSATDIPTGGSTGWLPCIDMTSYGPQTAVANFGQDPTFGGLESGTTYTSDNTTGVVGEFYSPIPSGYLPFAAGNLDAPVTPSEHFDILTYTGNSDPYNSSGSTQDVTGVNFDVGMAWIKDRDNKAVNYYTNSGSDEYGNYLFDTITGTSSGGYNLDYDVQGDGPSLNSSYYGVTSFSAGSGTSRGITVDEAGETNSHYDDGYGDIRTERYVAWLWKLGSTGSSSTWNSSYTAPNTEHYNASAGVTTLEVTPVSSGELEVAHSLSAAPEFFFVTDDSGYGEFSAYPAFHKDLTSGNYLQLDGDSGQSSDSTYFPSGAAHADYIKLGTIFADTYGGSHNTRIWAFTGVEGHSKFGTYDPNGNVDGPFIYTGFRPAVVLTKRIDSSGYGWGLKDSARDTYNPADALLHPNSSGAESTNEAIDLLSNGFKIRATNNTINSTTSSAKYIFAAWAEAPFAKANAR